SRCRRTLRSASGRIGPAPVGVLAGAGPVEPAPAEAGPVEPAPAEAEIARVEPAEAAKSAPASRRGSRLGSGRSSARVQDGMVVCWTDWLAWPDPVGVAGLALSRWALSRPGRRSAHVRSDRSARLSGESR